MASNKGELDVAPASPSNAMSGSQNQVPVAVGGGDPPKSNKRSQEKLLEEKDNVIKQLRANARANEQTIEELAQRLSEPAKVVQRTDQETQCVHSTKEVATQCEFSSLQYENQLEGLRTELKARQQDVKDREEDLMDRSRKLIDSCDEVEKLRDNVRVLNEQNETLLGILKEHSARVMRMKTDVVNKEKALERAQKQIKHLKASRYKYDDRTFIERTTTVVDPTEISVVPPLPSLYMGPEMYQAPPNRIELTEETTVVWEKLDGTASHLSGTTAVVRQNCVFFSKALTGDVIGYNVEKKEWFTLPRCPQSHFTLAVVDSLVTAVGGEISYRVTTSVLSFSEDTSPSTGHWGALIPEMNVARKSPAVVTTPHYMVVGGGEVEGSTFSEIVEILEIESHLWLMVPSLPHAGTGLSAVVCGDQLYMLGGYTQAGHMSCQVYMCSLSLLAQQSASLSTLLKAKKFSDEVVWRSTADLPAFQCACVCLGGHLVAVGGCDKDYNPSNQLWYYTLNGNAWHKLPDQMPTARRECLAVTVPVEGKIRLLVVGGFASHEIMSTETDAVEATTFK